MRLSAFFTRYERGRGVGMGTAFRVHVREKLNVQAPVRRSRRTGKLYAITRATPGAPPRKVTGNLRNKVREYDTAHGRQIVSWAPYGVFLEFSRKHPHPFWIPSLRELGLA